MIEIFLTTKKVYFSIFTCIYKKYFRILLLTLKYLYVNIQVSHDFGNIALQFVK